MSAGNPSKATRFIDQIKDATIRTPRKKIVTLSTGVVVEMYVTPLTEAERQRANKSLEATGNTFTMQLLIEKARNADGELLFSPGDVAELRREVRDSDLQKLQLAVFQDDEPPIDPKP